MSAPIANPDAMAGFSARTGSAIRTGTYENGMGASLVIRYVLMPGHQDYDGGLPGVGITWGREKWFVMARDAEHFWSQWPYSIFKDASPVSPSSRTASERPKSMKSKIIFGTATALAVACSAWLGGNFMATKKETVKVCDVCKKRVSDEGETHFGGHPHAGWFAVSMHGGPTDLRALRSQKEWDVCSKKCLQKLAATLAA